MGAGGRPRPRDAGDQPGAQKERLANAHSLSALQRFSSCPYQFLLATIYRLEPRDEPEPLVRLDPLTRGSLFHRVQAEFYRAMEKAGALPVTPDRVPEASKAVEAALDRVAAEYEEQLAPAIPRVWHDEINELRRDLGIWVQKMADDPSWVPAYFEFSFGLSDAGRDERSLKDPVTIDGRFVLRGSVDLIERSANGEALRVTDHKTGKNRAKDGLIVGGGGTLQPVLPRRHRAGVGGKVAEGLNLLHHGGRFTITRLRSTTTTATRASGAGVYRSLDRAGVPRRRACRASLHVVRFPPGLWSAREERVAHSTATGLPTSRP